MVKHVIISGRVQGVGFRHFVRKNAKKLGIKGWVKNRNDGKVEAVFAGAENDVRQMIELSKKGPVSSYVKDVAESAPEMNEEDFSSFEVRA